MIQKTLLSVCLLVSFTLFASEQDCIAQIEQSLKLNQQAPHLESTEAFRLAAMMRSTAENILHSESTDATNIKWNPTSDSYFSNYSTAQGQRVDIIYSDRGILLGYKLKSAESVYHQCRGGRNVSSTPVKTGKKNAKKK